ncbi:hypothetical protein ACQ4LE_005067 [Meloidogyne hapla]|uniref:Uncharacterized protein n=1 Tax=Meloidogyne hapla TaxID=6305 RepID=A0A1I8B3Y2_MELHA
MNLFFPLFLHFLLQFIFINLINCQHQSFANTKFELPQNLPEEEENVQIAANQDVSPETQQTTIQTTTEIITTTESTTSQQTSPLPTSPLPPQFNETQTQKTPLPILPNLVELPRFVERGNVQPITVPPSLVENNGKNQISISSTLRPQKSSKNNSSNKSVWGVLDQKWESWFRQDFDITNCPKGAETMAKSFRLKFPPNLLKHKKEKILAELLAIRLRECLKKQRGNYWMRMEKRLQNEEKNEGNERETDSDRNECRGGLVQEQIACMNVYAFSCQFIQPSFPFRLVPTRIIVQEARLAEDGAEKCKKFVVAHTADQRTVQRNLKRRQGQRNNFERN